VKKASPPDFPKDVYDAIVDVLVEEAERARAEAEMYQRSDTSVRKAS
jgi:hypothetical protein